MAHSTSGAPSERNATSASNHTSASADAQTSPRPRKAFPLRFLAGALAHWQIIASAVLLGGGVAGLAATYDDYCGMTELSYAPAALRSDFEEGSKVSGFRPGVMAAQIETESHWRVGVVSHQGAKGIAQFTDEAWNAEHYSFGNGGNVLNPHDAIAAQARYLSELRTRLAKYASNEDQLQDVVLAGYNAGPGSVEKYGGVPPFPETQNYVKTIRELADTKYKLTCSPDLSLQAGEAELREWRDPGNGWCSCGWYGSVPGGVGIGCGGGFCECFGSCVCERFCGFFGEAFGDEFRPLNSAYLENRPAYIAIKEYFVTSIAGGVF